ncbi:acetyl-coenzyme A synthetase N-terminal domain-containing protein, partial [Neorhizobium tomejilense]
MAIERYIVPRTIRTRAVINKDKYEKWYEESVEDPDKFWGKHGRRIDWFKPYTKVKNTSFKG